MSHGLVPSKSTVYVSNLPYELKNNDLHKIFEKYGKIVKVTVIKDRQTRKSKGVAFILFLTREDAQKCVSETNCKEMFGRTLKSSIAKDNGRTAEFIRRKNYPDKSFCYECGEDGHLSYKCTMNLLGEREPPPKKVRKRKKKENDATSSMQAVDSEAEISEGGEAEEDESLGAAIALEQEKVELEQYRLKVATGNYDNPERIEPKQRTRKRIKKSSYFSDEEESD